ncbi:alpha-glucuronidase family glycosyl hydrolase [Dyella mobilis]|uniref:Xylan alpha-1,2-glucuronidase n=1 Tax=Dyella mobilis TaxID=1849582 RepID=A0ABS2KMN5_9GAMM|nr:alpha-glucuronidase family glycosyl hydrolase [Dyella mobilis]MBM7132407.1 alpha-glucuronidase [Dyella mobilis]GLQ95605.1 xylan alpha-1,2-glucuronidase [Dyella mobilis]
MRACIAFAVILLTMACAGWARAEDGYDLWLRYRPLPPAQMKLYGGRASQLVLAADTPTQRATRDELQRGLSGLLGRDIPLTQTVLHDGAIVVGTAASSPLIARLHWDTRNLGSEGYLIRSAVIDGHAATAIVGNSDIGALYGAFRFLRLLQTGQHIDRLDLHDAPHLTLRVLDHWDYLNGQVERGYAGASIWDWWKLPDWRDPRYTDYARANASIGINGSVLNDVAGGATILTPTYLQKVAALADVFRPYGIRVYLSIRFSAPIEIGGLKTADPLDPQVRAWWRAKADEIYRLIPDFGGFLVKANSEGQPGPADYGRTHADGANVLADALAPHGGVVMWRAFVYSQANPEDRAKQAYDAFKPLDGQFRANVLVQVKNGPIDFQPREPFHPLFGAMPKTPLMMEFEITKEYLGFATHLVYLGPVYEEVLSSDTMTHGKGSTVAKVIDGSLEGHRLTGMAGDANIGTDRDWCGSDFNQANWYVFGRLAWNPSQSSRTIAEEWVRMTFSNDDAFVKPVVDMMMGSREAAVDYMTPLGLVHLMGPGHHYGPAPWDASEAEADWRPVYYHRADKQGIGFDRTRSGSDAAAQYAPPVAAQFSDIQQTPERFLLYFHHVPWDYRMRSGQTLWYELVAHYAQGVEDVKRMRETWRGLHGYVDEQRYQQTASFLAIQEKEAQWWRDACIAYFQSISGQPLPPGYAPPEHSLKYYQSLSFPYVPGFSSW